MKVKKGFTLVELLVVIVILGVVTGISIPLLRNIQEKNQERRYTIYADAVTKGAKLYLDAYAEDLFGRRLSGCVYVTYAQLEEKNLLKDISVEDMSCNSENTFVRIVKIENKYTYTTYLGCGEKGNDNKVHSVTVTYPEKNHIYEINSDECKGSRGSAVSILVPETEDFKKLHVTNLTVTSPTGIKANHQIYAVWRKDQNFDAVADTDWIRAQYQTPTGQQGKIANGEFVSMTSQQYATPINENGEYYLLVRVEQLEDLYDGKWINPVQSGSKYLSFGPFKVDNIAPNCTVEKSNLNTTAGVNATLTCEDEYSGCNENNPTSGTGLKANTTLIISDNAGNTANCPVQVTATTQRRSRTRSVKSCTNSCCGTTTCTRELTKPYATQGGCERNCPAGAGGCLETVGSNTICHYTESYTCNKSCSTASCCGYTEWSDWSTWSASTSACNSDTCQSQERTLYS